MTRDITVRCSPDADDLFMMRALLEGSIDTAGYRFLIERAPTDDLNRIASSGSGPDVIALSIAHYPAVAEHYLMLPHGGSMGEGYGPVVISSEPLSVGQLAGKRVAIPGLTTTAWATLRMAVPDLEPVVTPIVPYSLIFEALRNGEVDAGLVIHEGRLTYEDEGFHRVMDIGEWWADHTGGLPLPLGANAIRRDLGEPRITEVSALLKASIAHALEDRDAAIQWLLDQGSKLQTPEKVSEYLDMYANQRTLDYGDDGREAIQRFLREAANVGVLPPVSDVEFSP
ncbi:MAG: ABC transporter substrate-binding protein [Rhodobacterales bacterium]|nr:ABC transporter substrate-binding protein [Rhodobacterales bacterium]